MEIEIFEPKINKEHKYAVAVPCEGRRLAMIQTFPTQEALEAGYKGWYLHAKTRGITSPVPIEILNREGKCKIIKELYDSVRLEDRLGESNS